MDRPTASDDALERLGLPELPAMQEMRKTDGDRYRRVQDAIIARRDTP